MKQIKENSKSNVEKNVDESTEIGIKLYILEAITSSTIHGIDKIFKPRRTFLKIFWLIFFIVSTAACAYFIANSIMTYLRFEVVTKVQVIYEVPQLFPTVAICSSNIINNNKMIEFGKKILKQNGLPDPFRDTSVFGFNLTLAQVNLLIKYMVASSLKSQEDIKSMSIKYNDLFMSCTFNLQPCNESMFEWYYDIIFGSCFKFNYKNIQPRQLYTFRAGSLNSLKVELFAPVPTDPYSFAIGTGAYVVIQNASETSIGQRGIGAAVGTETLIQVINILFSIHKSFDTKLLILSIILNRLRGLL